MNTPVTSDEKMTAALVHGSVFLVFLGPVIPVLIWVSQRKKSKYVSFHALQAMGYQALIFWLWAVVAILIGLLARVLVFPLGFFLQRSGNPAATIFFAQIFVFVSIFGALGAIFLTGIAGAIFCLLGRDFRYPIMGKWLEQYLSYEPGSESEMDEAHEDQWVAAICHATIITRLWGIITPLIVWFTQEERSASLRFQSMQALIYQGIAIAAYFIGFILYMVSFFGMFFMMTTTEIMNRGKDMQGPGAVMMVIVFGVIMVFWLLFVIVLPLYYLLAGFASLRVARGHHFRYPLLGKLIEKRMEKPQQLEPMP